MASSGMLRRVTFVRTDVSEEFSASIIRATRIGELGTMLGLSSNQRRLCGFVFLRSVRRLVVTSNVVSPSLILVTLMKVALSSSETTVLTHGITSQKTTFFHPRDTYSAWYNDGLQCMN
jgi:hypothetical protein